MLTHDLFAVANLLVVNGELMRRGVWICEIFSAEDMRYFRQGHPRTFHCCQQQQLVPSDYLGRQI